MYTNLFRIFFRIGLFTFGGGYAMIPAMEAEIVDRHKWMDRKDFIDLLAMAQTCPGAMAVNISVFVGYKLRKLPGAIITTLGVALPSFLIILLVAMFFHTFQDNEVVKSVFNGIRPAHRRASVQHGACGTHRMDQHLDSRRMRVADMPARCESHICACGSRHVRLSVWAFS